MLRSLSNGVRRYPVPAAGATLATRYFCGDIFAQNFEQAERIDWRRTAIITSFGCLMGSGPVYFLFSYLYPTRIRPLVQHSRVASLSAFIAMDLGVLMPFVYLPVFYAVREVGYSPATHVRDSILKGWIRYKEGVFADMRAATAIMVPQDACLVFLVPSYLAVPFVSVTGFIWVVALSISRGANPDAEGGAAGGVASGADNCNLLVDAEDIRKSRSNASYSNSKL
uniref:Uncharacterized protein n=1 Tax=Coccolithus braarudii TaxID=221442 RepID=A0A7S0Q7Q4_9EUKA|mmetsp:Transcript_44748/g.95188  ORF Transcript_44748/g.95188 Transcript_44748/m.95188 type:complete len:225 (+) Transcript_44748:70-744(+)